MQQKPNIDAMGQVDLSTASAEELSKLLNSRAVTSEALVEQYFAQIQRRNHDGMNIRAIINTAHYEPTLELARQLDRECEEKGPRGPLHGIPILVKVRRLHHILTRC